MGGIILILAVVAINLAILQVMWWLSPIGPDPSGVARRAEDPVWLFGDPHKARRKYEERYKAHNAEYEARLAEKRPAQPPLAPPAPSIPDEGGARRMNRHERRRREAPP